MRSPRRARPGPRAGRTAVRRGGVGLAALLALTAPLAGCTSSGSAGGGDADCAWVLSYDAHTYVPLPGQGAPRHWRHSGARLGTGALPGCDEGRGKDPDQQVAVYRLAGVDPGQAVITQDDEIGVRDPRQVPDALRPAAPAGATAAAGAPAG
ncbi:DUF6281 family protein [Streptomyces sp. V4-01]|uniref:DUF6281 family protein n=1 Tax=Actinacidiphila polyblastidii TaxID=3110430 RepID=A0ABU7PBY5_9ACTN|nr:DUF6281 family protein [Streptomyces sp. V4-01]